MGKASFFLGEIGQATRMKLVVNMTMGTMMASLGESLVLAEAAGLNSSELLRVLDLGACSNPMFRLKGPKIASSDFTANFPLKHAQKDMQFALSMAASFGQALPVAASANDVYKSAMAEHAHDDFSAVIKGLPEKEK